mmetsp:Transcript_32631/g.56704  ORF Transcript_32631/g.56704 Transcript_32631/m.56704 type:complete len:88 (+) Transcript_32631:2696-2959(+)
MQRAPLLIYRDWHKAAKYMAEGNRTKELAIRSIVRSQWKSKRNASDPEEIEEFLEGAVRGLTNYYLHLIKTQIKEDDRAKENIFDQD